MTNRHAPSAPMPPPDLEHRAVAIALGSKPPPPARAALFLERGLAGGVEAFRRRFGEPSRRHLDAAARWLDASRAAGHRVLLLGGPGYPALLAESAAPPVAIEVAGPADLDRPAVAIVGSRRASPYGMDVARTLARALASSGLTVVSGLARGVDGVAHRASLEAGGVTVAVLGCGLDRIYPPEHRSLAARCASSGALVTEFPPGARPLPHHFPRRNRIIAGLTLGTVVVEAAQRSGSLSTARHANDNGREVCAVPGPIGSATSAGCHALIRTGAALVTSASDILDELGLEPRSTAADAPACPAVPDPEGDAGVVLRTIRERPSGVDLDAAVALSGLPIPAALAALSELERSGRIRRYPGDFLKVAGA